MNFEISADLQKRILDLAVDIQQVPAPTFEEQERANFVESMFRELGLSDIEQDSLANVYGRLPGGSGKPLLISAHLDTVFPAETDLTVKREDGKIYGPGIGDNSVAVAALIGLVWALRELNLQPPGDLWLVANVGEEGLGDLKGMRAVMEKMKDQVAATLVLEGMMIGFVCFQGIGSRRYRIAVEAPGGHSWGDFGKTSAIHTLVRLCEKLTHLDVPDKPKTTFNIGVIEGGASVNTIAETSNIQLDLRSESQAELQKLIEQVENIVHNFAAGDAKVELATIGDRPPGAIEKDHPVVQLAINTLNDLGMKNADLRASSTDANIPLSMGHPAICVGITDGRNPHRLSEYIETEPLGKGMTQLVRLVMEAPEIV